jgi:hypothetical protein
MLGSCPTLCRKILEVMRGIQESKLEIERRQAGTNGKRASEVRRDKRSRFANDCRSRED